MAYALQSQGATKYTNPLLDSLQPKKTTASVQSPSPYVPSQNMSMVSQGTNTGLINSKPTVTNPTPSTPVKKSTITNTDGSIVTHEYHAPETPSSYDTKSGFLTDYGKSVGAKAVQQKDPLYVAPVKTSPKTDPINNVTDRTNGLLNTGQFTPTEQGLVNGQSPYGQGAQQGIQGLLDSRKLNKVYSDKAQEIANTAGQAMSNVGTLGARGEAGYRTTGTSPVGEGNAAVLAQTTAAQQNAIAQGANMELAGNAQGLQAQGQAQSGLTSAAGQGLSGQGQLLNAAQNQASRAQGAAGTVFGAGLNTPTGYGQATFNPLTGFSSGGGQVQPGDPFYATLQQAAQQAANGQYSAIPGSITSNPVLNAQMNELAKQINPNYNPVTSAAQSAVSAQQVGNVANMTTAYKSAANLGSQLNDLITTFGINPGDINAVNTGIQKIAQNTSSSQYKALNNLITDLVATYSSILTPGASTDTARATAASLLDASAKGSAITQTLKDLDEQAKAKISGQTTGYGETPGGNTKTGSITWDNIGD